MIIEVSLIPVDITSTIAPKLHFNNFTRLIFDIVKRNQITLRQIINESYEN